jgi:hypothetical protein
MRRKCLVAVVITLQGCGDVPSGPVLDVEAKRLVKDYEENEVGADERYKGKVVRIKGEVDEISKGVFGGLSVTLNGPFLGGDVVCKFDDSEKAALAKLQPGDKVAIIGRVSGRFLNSASDVDVDDCRIE